MAEERKVAKPAKKSGAKPDIATIGGLLLAFGGILGGMMLEGGSPARLAQPTAAMIVIGGTLGAMLVTMPLHTVVGAVKKLTTVFFERGSGMQAAIDEIVGFATRARKSGLVSLDRDLEKIDDPFLKKALMLAVDGTDLKELKDMMELELEVFESEGESHAKVFEAAGGYSPTIGIIGAVLGLIQVMQHLENIEEVGKGIAVAFVATIYGVGVANIFFLPAASKIKARVHEAVRVRQMTLVGVCAIVEGMNPKLIATKLSAYAPAPRKSGKKAVKKGPVEAKAA